MSKAKFLQNPLKETLRLGQSLWYDGLVSQAEFERMIRKDGLRGATTNPVIFEKAIAGGQVDRWVKEAGEGIGEEEIYKRIAVEAVQGVADVFLPVHRQTSGHDGYVSVEVSPLLAYDTEVTIREARELFRRVNRKNIMIKIPATSAGLPAIQTAISEGIHVNVTLIFSVARYNEVMDAYIAGLESRVRAGGSVNDVASVASFFVSRVDTAVDKLLQQKIDTSPEGAQKDLMRGLLGKAAVANSKVAYAEFERTFTEDRFRALKSLGAQVQRPLWASTGTKNPAYRDVVYVESLIGPNTVNTVPPATLEAFRDHGTVEETLTDGLEEARRILEGLESAGIALAAVTADLEKAGVELFKDAYLKIIQRIRDEKR